MKLESENRICAGIVTYNPDRILFLQCLSSIRSQVDEVFIFDNGSENANFLVNNVGQAKNTLIIYNNYNAGISVALNKLCELAEQSGYEWIVTMDQDSICAEDMVDQLSRYIDCTSYGVIAPRVEFKSGDKLIHKTQNRSHEVEKVRACITSGSLTQIAAWRKIGGFDEWMFIDRVDNEFCTHLWVDGYSVVRVNSAVLYQRAGEMNYLSLPFGKKLLLPCYSEFRNYYICRNTIYYLKKYRKHINYWHELSVFVYSQLLKILFESNKIGTIKSTFIGIKDGLKKQVECM